MQLSDDSAPTLRTPQNLVNYYTRTKLGNNDRYDRIIKMVHDAAFTGLEDDIQSFMFGWNLNEHEKPVVGNGSDNKQFLVGVISRTLLKRLDRDPRTFVLHIDATFKLNQVSYPVLVVGLSDYERRFHLSAMIVLSQIVEGMYAKALSALRRVFTAVCNKPLRVYYVMGDADDGQFNAVQQVIDRANNYIYLMCFFHVMKNVNDRLKNMDERTANILRKDIYDLHFAEGPQDFIYICQLVLPRWRAAVETAGFAEYFKNVWMSGKFIRCQCFQSSSTYATTNNPAEQFNRVLKRNYTLRRKLKMGALLQHCCRNESNRDHIFVLEPTATDALQRRSREMERKLLLEDANPNESLFAENPLIHVRSYPAERIYIQSKDRNVEILAVTAQMGVNYARMEFEGMPTEGWGVNVVLKTCQCRYYRKFVFVRISSLPWDVAVLPMETETRCL